MGVPSSSHRETVGDVLGPTGGLVWVFHSHATNHITNDARNAYDKIDIASGREIGLMRNPKGNNIEGIGNFNLKMHSKTYLNIILTGVWVTEGIGFNCLSLFIGQARQTVTFEK